MVPCRWVAAVALTCVTVPSVLRQAALLSMSVAHNWAAMSISGSSDEKPDPLVLEYRMIEAMEKAPQQWHTQLTFELEMSRALLRSAGLFSAFAFTGNLAASWSVAIASNLLLLAYYQKGKKYWGLGTELDNKVFTKL